MKNKQQVSLGFEVGTAEPVEIPIRHMVVTGQTQEAGKTTTLEGLIARAGLPAIAFVTKRGERSFANGRRIQPYFRERADWQFVASVLEATMREKLKFERAWIMRASKGAQTLADVQKNVRELMMDARGISADIYMTLDAYLDIVVPRIANVTFAKSIDLKPGINVVDVSDRDSFPPELQGLVMRSVLEWIYENARGTITIIPEAWEFVPQGRGSPVKLAAVELIRKGAGLQNYVWLDTQDIGGVDKELLRSCPVWLLGVQREANEIKRVLGAIPSGTKKPKASDVALLGKGEFFACFGADVIRTYVQPAWMPADEAAKVSVGSVATSTAPVAQERHAPRSPTVKAAQPDEAEVYERGRRHGFEQGYAAASSTVAAQMHGVIESAQAFLDELKELARSLADAAESPPQAAAAQPGVLVHAENLEESASVIVPGGIAQPADRKQPAWMKTLAVLASRYPMWLRPGELAAFAGMAPRGGGFLGHLREIRKHGYVEESEGVMRITAAGLEIAGRTATVTPTTTEGLIELWSSKLPGAQARRALEFLTAMHPDSVAVDELANHVEMAPRGGAYLSLLRHIKRNGLAEAAGRGRIRAGSALLK